MTRSSSRPASFWVWWLRLATLAVSAFGAALVLAPELARQGFSLLVYAERHRIASFGADAAAYIALVHAVLGSVMLGWGLALWFVVRGPFARGTCDAWTTIAVSVAARFVPDTAFSLWSGFWQNAALNLVIATTLAIPLAATYRACHASALGADS
jgi:hypothetical protein